jgi:hypothetical protein
MKGSVVVKTEVEVDLSDFATRDLINELEDRGHIVDGDCAAQLDTEDLLQELSDRAYTNQFSKVRLDVLIKTLAGFGCPGELVQQLLEWEREPVPTAFKLARWIESCSQD